MKNESIWFCVWAIVFAILYCSALAWPIVMIFIWEIEEKVKKIFVKQK